MRDQRTEHGRRLGIMTWAASFRGPVEERMLSVSFQRQLLLASVFSVVGAAAAPVLAGSPYGRSCAFPCLTHARVCEGNCNSVHGAEEISCRKQCGQETDRCLHNAARICR
jgi:hypothetical protein